MNNTFSLSHNNRTEELNNWVIEKLQEQGDLPLEGPWEHVNMNGHTLDYYTCMDNACGRITYKVKDNKIVLCQFYPMFGANISRCDACAKRAGHRRLN